jgi:hypothetical protein
MTPEQRARVSELREEAKNETWDTLVNDDLKMLVNIIDQQSSTISALEGDMKALQQAHSDLGRKEYQAREELSRLKAGIETIAKGVMFEERLKAITYKHHSPTEVIEREATSLELREYAIELLSTERGEG